MNFLMISLNRADFRVSVAPIGAASVCGYLSQQGYTVGLVDLRFSNNWKQAVNKSIKKLEPQVIGLSLRNLSLAGIESPELDLAKEIVDFLKSLGKGPIVIGGAGFSDSPKAVMDITGADIGVIGEGEQPLNRILEAVKRKEDLNQLDAVLQTDDGRLILKAQRPLEPEYLPSPTVELYNKRYFAIQSSRPPRGKITKCLGVQTKRGCAMRCIYCGTPKIEGRRLRMKNPDQIVDELKRLQKSGMRHFCFVDNEFNIPPSQAAQVCETLIKNKFNFKWTALCHPRHLDAELLYLMGKAGCVGIFFDTGAACNRMLKSIEKGTNLSEILRASTWCRRNNITYAHHLMLGGPGEDYQSVKESFEMMEAADPLYLPVMIGLPVYKGTALEKSITEQDRLVVQEGQLGLKFYIDPQMNDSRIWDLIESYASSHPNWFFGSPLGYPLRQKLEEFFNSELKQAVKPLVESSRITRWEPDAKRLLEEVILIIPEFVRDAARINVQERAKKLAAKANTAIVRRVDVVNSFLELAPPEGLPALARKLQTLGIKLDKEAIARKKAGVFSPDSSKL